jgi:histidinol dehydrogenase
MKTIRTKGRGARTNGGNRLAALEQRGGAALDTVLPAVKRIVADVRKQGDRALLRYATQFDGLASASSSARYTRRDGRCMERNHA